MNTTSVAPAGASTGRWPLRLFGAALVLIALPLLAGGLYLITLGGCVAMHLSNTRPARRRGPGG